jgi:N-carbamoylputrescine amidase
MPAEWEPHEATWIAWPHREEILAVECDPRRQEEVRRNWPCVRDRRVDAYAPIGSGVID